MNPVGEELTAEEILLGKNLDEMFKMKWTLQLR